MSIKIRSTFSDSSAVLVISPIGGRADVVTVRVTNLHTTAAAVFTVAEFLSAVETECGVRIVPADAIVIERATLSKVETSASRRVVEVGSMVLQPDDTHESLTRDIIALVALREYLDAVPPVSDEDVETLAGVLAHEAPGIRGTDVGVIARRLLATGRVSVTHE